MNVADFKTRLAGFMSRATTDFVNGTVDQLLCAINDARRSAQMRYNFQRFRTEGFISTSILGADFTTTVYPTPAVTTALGVKLIEKAWTYNTRSISAGTLYERAEQLDYRTDRQLGESLPLAGTGTNINNYQRTTTETTGRTIAWVKGSKFYVNAETAAYYLVEIVSFAPDLIDADTTDFFLTYGQQWLLFSAAQILNGYLKEDQRVAISQKALEKAWEELCQFDSDVAISNDSGDWD
jgi:hypothetical protein